MRVLSPPELEDKHQNFPPSRLDGVGDLLLETKEFRDGARARRDIMRLFCFAGAIVGWERHIPGKKGNPLEGQADITNKSNISSLLLDSPHPARQCWWKRYPLHRGCVTISSLRKSNLRRTFPRFGGRCECYSAVPYWEAS